MALPTLTTKTSSSFKAIGGFLGDGESIEGLFSLASGEYRLGLFAECIAAVRSLPLLLLVRRLPIAQVAPTNVRQRLIGLALGPARISSVSTAGQRAHCIKTQKPSMHPPHTSKKKFKHLIKAYSIQLNLKYINKH